MPLGILSIAAILIENGLSVEIFQPKIRILQENQYNIVVKEILKRGANIIGFSTWCISYPSAILLAKEIKKLSPETTIIFGGPQASIIPKKTLEEFSFIDFVLAGEADHSFLKFVSEHQKTNPDFELIKGLYYRNTQGKIIQNRSTDFINNLDKLPLPAYHLIPGQKTVKIDAGRGCPFKCTYCTTNDFFSKKYRTKSVERIVQEMNYLFDKFDAQIFGFMHDMFTLNKEFIAELSNKLIKLKQEKNKDFLWTCSARIDCISEEMLRLMHKADCESIFFGIETGSENIQKSIKKNLNIKKSFEVADKCRNLGIEMHASFIIGFPDETKDDINKTLGHAAKLLLKGAFVQCSTLSLLPGTTLYKKHKNELKFDGKFSDFSKTFCSQQELELIQKYPEIFSSFYYLPVNSLKKAELDIISLFIGKSKEFINTFFLMREEILNEFGDKPLLELIQPKLKDIINQRNSKPVIMYLIEFLNEFITRKNHLSKKFILDVFNYEAYTAILKNLFLQWQLIDLPYININTSTDFLIKPTPVWKIISTNYKLEKVIPQENNWENNSHKFRRGNYSYLLVAKSELNCKRIPLSAKNTYLTTNLSEIPFSEYVEKVKTVSSQKETLSWIKKLKKLGVITVSAHE